MGGHGTLCATLLLLIWHSGGVDADTKPRNLLTGENIYLNLSYNPSLLSSIVWYKDTDKLAKWDILFGFRAVENEDRTKAIKNQTLVIYNSTKSDSGNYRANVSYLDQVYQIQWSETNFPVKIYDPVGNVTVIQSPQLVDDTTAAVNLSCNADGDIESVTWKRDGVTLANDDHYLLLDRNCTLQIRNPSKKYIGDYFCNASNPRSANNGTGMLNATYTENLSGGALAGVVIGSILGAILLIALLVILIFCFRKRKNGKVKNLGGPQVKKDPDIYTVNNLMYSNPSISQSADIKMSKNRLPSDDQTSYTMNNLTSRSSTFSNSSVIRDPGDNMSQHTSPTPNPPSGPPKIKRVTQI